MDGSSSEEDDANWVFYRDRAEWADLQPLPQDDGPHPVVAIAYSDKFRDVYDYFRGVLKVHELSERALDLTRDAVELNAGNYTVWQYRREILKHLNKDLKEEMAFVEGVISDFPKNYQVWHHRQVLVSWLNDGSEELSLTAKMLAMDAKNYHAWQHRQWVIRTFKLFDNELEFIEKLLNDDIRNNSAWNQRYFVINQTTAFSPEVIEKEIAFVLSKIRIASRNESSWNYLRGILLHCENGLREPSVIDFCAELYNAENRSPYLLGFLIDAAQEHAEAGAVKENNLLSIDQALEIFPIPRPRADEDNYFVPVSSMTNVMSLVGFGLTAAVAVEYYMDASRTWLCYWITHSMELLDFKLPADDKSHIARFLAKCQGPDGGFGGGPGQFGHLAPTYAAVNTLCTLGTEEAYKAIDRKKLLEFLWSVRQPNGSFGMHVGGEIDVRGVYCAVSVARLTNIYSDALFDNSAEWIISCQTYEGGFSGSPGHEAHGGYAFCALAALCLLYKEHLCDIKSLLRWTVNRQMRLEGGFQGRTNKLVDGCYSFWQAGAMPLIQGILAKNGTDEPSVMNEVDNWLFNSRALQEYILIYCQTPNGGLIDKPGKSRDLYHTCYTLSGLSIAQHQPSNTPTIVGTPRNLLKTVHPTFNIESEKLQSASLYFSQLPSDFL